MQVSERSSVASSRKLNARWRRKAKCLEPIRESRNTEAFYIPVAATDHGRSKRQMKMQWLVPNLPRQQVPSH